MVDSDAIGRRSLKNTCLQLLAEADSTVWLDRVMDQLTQATNMTDSIAALRILCQSDLPERETALAAFYEQWQSDRLVTDKWFSLQATARRKSVIDEVVALAKHPAFELSNPNRVRSLIGAVCHVKHGGDFIIVVEMGTSCCLST